MPLYQCPTIPAGGLSVNGGAVAPGSSVAASRPATSAISARAGASADDSAGAGDSASADDSAGVSDCATAVPMLATSRPRASMGTVRRWPLKPRADSDVISLMPQGSPRWSLCSSDSRRVPPRDVRRIHAGIGRACAVPIPGAPARYRYLAPVRPDTREATTRHAGLGDLSFRVTRGQFLSSTTGRNANEVPGSRLPRVSVLVSTDSCSHGPFLWAERADFLDSIARVDI